MVPSWSVPGNLRVLGRHQALAKASGQGLAGVGDGAGGERVLQYTHYRCVPVEVVCRKQKDINGLQMQANQDFEVEQSSCSTTRGGAGAGAGAAVAVPPFIRRATVRHAVMPRPVLVDQRASWADIFSLTRFSYNSPVNFLSFCQ